jgi:hypothetical protein
MATGKLSKLLALFLALMLPCSLIAADSRGAILNATNSVIVNGSPTLKTATLFPGDKLTVPADSSATITLTGTSILVPKQSSLTYTGPSVQLERQAAVAVTTTSGMAAQISDLKISPAKDGSAQFQVARYNGKVFIAAKQGTVLIASAEGSKVLEEGKTTTVADPEPQNPGAVPATTGVGSGGEMPTWVAVLIGTAAVGAAAAAAIVSTGVPVSPTHP